MSKYFPIFRGKQFELIAIRDFAESGPIGIVHPIIEPVRDPEGNNQLQRTIDKLQEKKVDYTIVVNPTKGKVAKLAEASKTIVDHVVGTTAATDHLSFGLLFHEGGDTDQALAIIDDSELSRAKLNLIYDSPLAGRGDIGKLGGRAIGHHVVEQKATVRDLNVFDKPSFIYLSKTFKRQDKNLDYLKMTVPYLFCSAHLYLADDGFSGLSDFLTIGDDYSESGSLPLALVIHFTYVNTEDQNKVYIAHFCSDTNNDTSDPGKKFAEAVAKLIGFVDINKLPNNPAIDGFRSYRDDGKFPGLGMIKKLSMLNHLYVMDAALRPK